MAAPAGRAVASASVSDARYDVVALLGRGGTGVVELAELPDGTRVARKRIALHGSARQAEVALRRLRREAEALAAVRHPNVVRLLAVEDEGESVVLMVPWLEGGSLHDRVALGPLPADEVEALARALLSALSAAHAVGVVHRDVSPGNICFDADGTPVLVDFGAAACHEFTAGLTGDGCVIGTPAFLSPEQAQGRPAGPPADVFGLGACLWFALTGASPITGAVDAVEPGAAIAAAAAFAGAGAARPALPDGTAPGLVRLLASLLDPDPRRRPPAAAALPLAATTVDRTLEGPPVVRRRHRRAVLVAAAVVVGGAGAGLVARSTGGSLRSGLRAQATGAAAIDACPPLPYRSGCGGPVAPNTDGHRCTGSSADYDGRAANGCEATPDRRVDGARMASDRPVEANLVPATDVDTFSFVVADRFQWSCDGLVQVTLTAPAGAAYRLDVLQGSEALGSATSADGRPATVSLPESRCLDDDGATLTARVSPAVGSPKAASYRIGWTGSY